MKVEGSPQKRVRGDPHAPPRRPFCGTSLYTAETLRVGATHRVLIYAAAEARVKKPVGKILVTFTPGGGGGAGSEGGAGSGSAHVDSVWVAEVARGFGLGRVLLHQAVTLAHDLGARLAQQRVLR
jgi:GNAT superfamily N-acetyltransferase